MADEKAIIKIRKATEADVPFIFSSWLKSYRSSFFGQNISTTIFYNEHHKVIERLLKSCEVWIACNDNDSTELYGFICAEVQQGILIIHYTYVKQLFRTLGIGKMLLRAINYDSSKATIFTHNTKHGQRLANRFNLVHSPYIALTPDYRKEELDTERKRTPRQYEGEDDK